MQHSNIGAGGVDLFFVISGFIMVYTTYDTFGRDNVSVDFLRRRIIRIVPAYWFYTTIVAALLFFVPQLFSSTQFEWQTVVSSYLFLLSEIRPGDTGTILQTGWTLCYEVYFYLIFAVLLAFPRNLFLVFSGSLFLMGIGGGLVLGSDVPQWTTVAMNPIILEFYLGSIIAFAFMKGFVLSRSFAGLAIVFGLAVIFLGVGAGLGEWKRVVCWGLPAGAILLGVISLERAGMKVPKLLVTLGNSSYSLYLAHPLMIPVAGKLLLLLNASTWIPVAIPFLFVFVATIAAGHILYLVIEKPLIGWLSKTWPAPAR